MLILGSVLAQAEPYVDTSLTAEYVSNTGNAAKSRDKEDDYLVSGGAEIGWPYTLNEHSGVLVNAGVEMRGHLRWQDLSEAVLNARAAYRFKPNPAFSGMWYEVFTAGSIHQQVASALRDRGEWSIGVTTGTNFTDKLRGDVGYRFDLSRAWRSSVFDADAHVIHGILELQFTPTLLGYTTAQWRAGEVVSSAVRTSIIDAATIIDANDPALSTAESVRRAYQFDGRTTEVGAGLNLALDNQSAIDLSMSYEHTSAKFDYEGVNVLLAVLHRF